MFINQYIKRLIRATFILVIFGYLTTAGADPSELTIATHDYTSDWHPIRGHSYPAQHVTRLTTRHLLEEACIGSNDDDQPVASFRGNMDAGFLKICLSNQLSINTNQFINLKAIDSNHCPGLSTEDVDFTVKQINEDMGNDYRYFQLEVKGTRLWINNPVFVPADMIRRASSFPILKNSANATTLANRRFEAAGSEQDYNALTHGRYQIATLTPKSVELELRNEKVKANMTLIKLKSFYQQSQLLQSRVDVILDLTAQISVC